MARAASHPKVDVFAFVDPGDYLRKVLADLKRQKNFRLGSFAQDAGFRSPSLLSMILHGKRRLSPWSAERLARALALRGKQRGYFLAMERWQNGRSPEERAEAHEVMLRLKSSVEPSQLRLQQYRFIATWYYPVIYVMTGMQKMKWDARWIAARLGRGVTAEKVKIALSDLMRLGLLSHDTGEFRRAFSNPTTGEDIKSTAIYRYHRQMIGLSAKALELPLELREMNGLTVAIPKSQLPVVKERIRKFRKELNDYLAPFEGESDEVFQVNVHLFPLTEKVEESAVKREFLC